MSGATTSSLFPYSEFVFVSSRKKRKNKVPKERPSPITLLQRLRKDLQQDDWFAKCQQILTESLASASFTSPDVLCLGLGSPTTSLNARVQLAFLLEMCDSLEIDRMRMSIYDPVFTAEDIALFGELLIPVLAEDKKGRYVMNRPTICFMPHCDMELYENILTANWSPETLPNLILIANRLADYVDNNPRQHLQSMAPCISSLVPSLQYHPLPASSSWSTAFNNISIQFVELRSGSLPDLVEIDGNVEYQK